MRFIKWQLTCLEIDNHGNQYCIKLNCFSLSLKFSCCLLSLLNHKLPALIWISGFAQQNQYQSSIAVWHFCWLFFIMLMVTNRICLLQHLGWPCKTKRYITQLSGWTSVCFCVRVCVLYHIHIYAPSNIFLLKYTHIHI